MPTLVPGDHRPGQIQPVIIVPVNLNKWALIGGYPLTFPGIRQTVFCLWVYLENLIDVMKGNVFSSIENYSQGIITFNRLIIDPF